MFYSSDHQIIFTNTGNSLKGARGENPPKLWERNFKNWKNFSKYGPSKQKEVGSPMVCGPRGRPNT